MTECSPEAAQPVVVILGAGMPFRGAEPSALLETVHHVPAMEWCLRAFAPLQPEFHFVGGYQVDKVRRQFPQLQYSINSDWENTNATASLLAAPLDAGIEHFVCYSDIVFENDVVEALCEAKDDVVVAVDSTFFSRPHFARDAANYEKARVVGGKVEAVGKVVEESSAFFVGVVKLSHAALHQIHALRAVPKGAHLTWTLSRLIDHLREGGLSIAAVDIAGRWATFDERQDVARFVLGTKAETLKRMRPLVRKSRILEQYMVPAKAWEADPVGETARAIETLGNRYFVVRSSARTEDGWTQSNAGHYRSILNVAPQPAALRKAVDTVFADYQDDAREHQVLIQPMLADVRLSGVAFTRTLRHGAPYFVINYDTQNGSTDTVTSGAGRQLKMLVAYRNRETTAAPPELANLLPAIREIEKLVGYDSLDIEFAIDQSGAVFVLQLRPIVVDASRWQSSDEQVEVLLNDAEARFVVAAAPRPNQAGPPAFGVMPDWNPAEIIGIRPRRLALSLYQYLITDEVWAQQRAECGFRDVRPFPLVTTFAGHPYVDVRASFNSFVPAQLTARLGDRLAGYYLHRLAQNPAWHDKVEFEIALTCRTLAFARRARPLAQAGFSAREIGEIEAALGDITKTGIAGYRAQLNRAAQLNTGLQAIKDVADPLERSAALLEDCRRFGTLPFAHLARQGFVAVEMLRSAVEEEIITAEDFDGFMRSLKTVASVFSEDAARHADGLVSQSEFISHYGHLRPGTYDVTSLCYADDPQIHAAVGRAPHGTDRHRFEWPAPARKALSAALPRLGLDDDIGRFDEFLRGAIEGREWSKFEFTRHLSLALNSLVEFGARHNVSREQLSHMTWNDLDAIRRGLVSGDIGEYLASHACEGAEFYRSVRAVELPPLILAKDDIWCFVREEDKANFIGSGKATAAVLDLSEHAEPSHADLHGKIVIIQQADPGYDWLFLRGIVGLITVYGGANSHMAIRTAEFGLPAAIGIGEVSYEHIRGARSMMLDCESRQLRVLQ
jgi:choline kinase